MSFAVVSRPNFLASFSVCSLGVIQLIKFLSVVSVTNANIMVLAVGIICLIYVVIKHGAEGPTGRTLIFLLAYTMFGAFSFFYNGNMDPVELLWPLGYMSIGILLLNEGIPMKISKIVFLLFSCVLLFEIIKTGGVGNVAFNFSRNMVSVYALLLLSFVILSSITEKKGIPLVYPIVFVFLCFAAVGRSGIMTGILCVVLFLFFDFSKENVERRNFIVIPISIGILCVFTFLIYKLFPEIIDTALLNFESRGIESQRSLLWMDYWKKTFGNFFDVLYGAEISGTPALNRYNENLHNSFFMLHAKYGIFMLINVILMIVNAVKIGLKDKNYHLLLVIVLIVFRMNFDYTNFNDCLDCVLIYVLFFNDFLQNKHQLQIIEVNKCKKGE